MVATRTDTMRYTRTAIALHWAIAALIVFNLSLGYFMEGFGQPLRGTIVALHISSGITVLALTVARVFWRLTHEPPPYPADMKPWERHLAHLVHLLLYAAMILMPLTGWAIISAHPPPDSPGAAVVAMGQPAPPPPGAAQALPPTARPRASPPLPRGGIKVWGVVRLPPIAPIQKIGETPGGVAPQKELHEEFVTWHGLGGYVLILLLLFHVAGALKHQLIDRRRELARMGIGKPEAAVIAAE